MRLIENHVTIESGLGGGPGWDLNPGLYVLQVTAPVPTQGHLKNPE